MTETNAARSSDATTRAKIRLAAEELFAEQGFANTSLRAITARAEVNLAAVNYHFGSKEALIQEIFSSRLDALNRARLERLAELERASAPPSVERLLHAYLAPVFLAGGQSHAAEARFMQLLGRTQLGASQSLRGFVNALYGEVLDRFANALARALPQLSAEEMYWRLHFLTGTVAYSLGVDANSGLFKLPQTAAQQAVPADNDALLARLIAFAAAGLRAPAPDLSA